MIHPTIARAMLGGRRRGTVIDLSAEVGGGAAGGYELAGDWKPFKTPRMKSRGAVNSAGEKLYGEDAERVLAQSRKKPAFVESDLKQHKNETEGRQKNSTGKRKRSKLGRQVAVGYHKGMKRLKALTARAQRGVEAGYHGVREFLAGQMERAGLERSTGRAVVDSVAGVANAVLGLVGFNSGGALIARTARQVAADRKGDEQKKAMNYDDYSPADREEYKSQGKRDERHDAMNKDKALGWASTVDLCWMVATVATGFMGFGWVGAMLGGLVGLNVPLGSTIMLACQAATQPMRTLGAAWKAFIGVGEATEFKPTEIEDVQAEGRRKKETIRAGQKTTMATDDGAGGKGGEGGEFGREEASQILVERKRKGFDLDWWCALLAVGMDHAGNDLRKAAALADRVYKKHRKQPAMGEDEALDLLEEQFSARLKGGKKDGKGDGKGDGKEGGGPFG